MTFSIIIPAYNAAAYLSRCLDSIFSQDYTDHEVIVINDGSTDGTASLLKDYIANHSNLQIVSQTNQGISTARNQGINVAQGNYVMFVDSDDELMPHALSTLATQLDNTDIVSFGTKIHTSHLSPLIFLPAGTILTTNDSHIAPCILCASGSVFTVVLSSKNTSYALPTVYAAPRTTYSQRWHSYMPAV